jgi:hypothetical protein
MIYEKVFFEVIKSSHYSGIILNFTAETQRTQSAGGGFHFPMRGMKMKNKQPTLAYTWAVNKL